MKLQIFTKTYSKDLPWLQMALRSVFKKCREEIDWHIAVEDSEYHLLFPMCGHAAIQVHKVEEIWPEAMQITDGYLRQQWIKMNSHKVMGDGVFLNWDSDTIAVRDFDIKNFLGARQKPVMWFTPINDIINGSDEGVHNSRRQMMKELFKMEHVCFEFMRTMPMMVIGGILRHASGQYEWQKSFEMLKGGERRFSEFNVMGQFSLLFFPDAFEWRNTTQYECTWAGGINQAHSITSQMWSWGGIPDECRKFVDSL